MWEWGWRCKKRGDVAPLLLAPFINRNCTRFFQFLPLVIYYSFKNPYLIITTWHRSHFYFPLILLLAFLGKTLGLENVWQMPWSRSNAHITAINRATLETIKENFLCIIIKANPIYFYILWIIKMCIVDVGDRHGICIIFPSNE